MSELKEQILALKQRIPETHCNCSVMSGAGHSLALQEGSRWITRLLATQNNNFQTMMLIDEI